jgi:hypothetical protein
MVTPTLDYDLYPSGLGTEPFDTHHPIVSHCLHPPSLVVPFWGCEAPGRVICSGC